MSPFGAADEGDLSFQKEYLAEFKGKSIFQQEDKAHYIRGRPPSELSSGSIPSARRSLIALGDARLGGEAQASTPGAGKKAKTSSLRSPKNKGGQRAPQCLGGKSGWWKRKVRLDARGRESITA